VRPLARSSAPPRLRVRPPFGAAVRASRASRSLGSLRRVGAAVLFLVGAAAPAAAQGVLLQIRPRLGDTLRMRLEQTAEMSGSTRIGNADSTMTVTTAMRVLTHAVVQRHDATTTTLLSVTDSVSLSVTGSRAASPETMAAAARKLEGRQAVLRLAHDGSAEVVGGDRDLPPSLGALLAAMPASLPRTPVSVGGSWVREMAIPGADGTHDAAGGGTLRATFHLDSLTRDDVAFVSVRGSIERDGEADGMPAGVTLSMRGTVQGELRVDRRRAWVTHSQTTFTINSVMTPPSGSTDGPVRVRMKLVQKLHCDAAR
jgi:hypothetical protein